MALSFSNWTAKLQFIIPAPSGIAGRWRVGIIFDVDITDSVSGTVIHETQRGAFTTGDGEIEHELPPPGGAAFANPNLPTAAEIKAHAKIIAADWKQALIVKYKALAAATAPFNFDPVAPIPLGVV